MAQLTFPMPSGELTLTVIIGHDRQTVLDLLARGQPIPSPIWTKGVVDTGSNVTCVAPAVLQRLGLVSIGKSSTHTAGGTAGVNLFRISLSIPPPGKNPGPLLTRPDLIVMELPYLIPDVEVLIGLDILLDCKLLLDGPARQFTLEF